MEALDFCCCCFPLLGKGENYYYSSPYRCDRGRVLAQFCYDTQWNILVSSRERLEAATNITTSLWPRSAFVDFFLSLCIFCTSCLCSSPTFWLTEDREMWAFLLGLTDDEGLWFWRSWNVWEQIIRHGAAKELLPTLLLLPKPHTLNWRYISLHVCFSIAFINHQKSRF